MTTDLVETIRRLRREARRIQLNHESPTACQKQRLSRAYWDGRVDALGEVLANAAPRRRAKRKP
jgi:hypothetical protein